MTKTQDRQHIQCVMQLDTIGLKHDKCQTPNQRVKHGCLKEWQQLLAAHPVGVFALSGLQQAFLHHLLQKPVPQLKNISSKIRICSLLSHLQTEPDWLIVA